MFFKENWGFISNFVALSEYIDFKEKAALLEKEQNAVWSQVFQFFFSREKSASIK